MKIKKLIRKISYKIRAISHQNDNFNEGLTTGLAISSLIFLFILITILA